jgi:hypothetical protein
MDTDKVVREEDIRFAFPNLQSVEVQSCSGHGSSAQRGSWSSCPGCLRVLNS